MGGEKRPNVSLDDLHKAMMGVKVKLDQLVEQAQKRIEEEAKIPYPSLQAIKERITKLNALKRLEEEIEIPEDEKHELMMKIIRSGQRREPVKSMETADTVCFQLKLWRWIDAVMNISVDELKRMPIADEGKVADIRMKKVEREIMKTISGDEEVDDGRQ